jgi:signal transduction histidine kinase/DNA-binding NarL/FixJ family response regulator
MLFNSRVSDAPRSGGGFAGLFRAALWHPAMVPTALCAGVVVSLLAAGLIQGWEQRSLKQNAKETAEAEVGQLQTKALRSMEILYSVAALFDAQGRIGRAEFTSFVRKGLSRQPELLALEWVPRVPESERAAYESAARANGLEDFCFREVTPSGQSVPAAKRPEYVPVYYVEPRRGNESAVGYDLNSDTSRRLALEQARDSGHPVATAPLHLVQESAEQTGLLVLLPVYRGLTPSTLSERRDKLAGFAVAVFRVDDLVAGAINEMERKGLAARLVDVSAQEPIYNGSGVSNSIPPAPLAEHTDFEMAGRRWTLEFQPTARFSSAQPRGQWLLVLAGGLFLTFLVTSHFYREWKRARESAAANAALQEEIAVRQEAEKAASSANQAKSDFLASMSHEIRTPLNAILGYAQLLQHDRQLTSEQRDSIEGIRASGRHLLGLINEILDLAKIEAGRMELNPVDFDVTTMASSLRATFQPLCAQKRIGFRIECGAGAQWLHGDEGKLRQVLINLLGNAMKFTGVGEIYLGIRAQTDDGWLFEVIDTGLGVPEEEQTDIFKPFHQGRNAAHRGGTGLGLAIAQRQVELLGGILSLHSERGIGSRFYFTIPLLPAQRDEAAQAAALSQRRLKPGVHVRALVIDDRKENREVLAGMLALAGCEVDAAENGEEGLALACKKKPDIVFVDLIMPNMDGFATARELLSDPCAGRPKIVANSAAALSCRRDEARAAGCVDFLTKPIAAEQVQECLRLHLGVELESAPVHRASLDALLPWEGPPVRLPEELCARLVTAAELHSTTALKSCLQELRQLEPEACRLAEHIRHLMRSYDMHAILRLMAQTVPIDSSSPAIPPDHGFAQS